MRIAVWHNLPSGGGKRALYHHVRGLVGRGHVVDSWCPPTADPTFLPLSELITEKVVPLGGPAERRLGYLGGKLGWFTKPYRTVMTNIRAMDQHCRQCADEINRGNYDLLFANSCVWF